VGAIAVVGTIAGGAASLGLHYLRTTLDPFPIGDKFVLPRGRTLDGVMIDTQDRRASCYLIRYADEQCSFCKRDKDYFANIEVLTKARGCDSIVMAPTPESFERPLIAHRLNLGYVDLETARAVTLAETPTTLIIGADAVIKWSKRGTLTPEDLEVVRNRVRF
jgi:hypothetical protein